ncbi:hypothetical protein [Bradyrhizobium sp. STM 3809]|uniref:hypothetical protein n=1 Tax=Bradyrhizobium sp. STM 3809 TaxID=551936 RepID=UPI0002409938|nr:hypothetical protein [Bradyrhizobium sp. STM 3809]CCE02448.1 conserved hypothetical protein [Bradyrhizobium sp. STM 3809]
MDAHQIAVAKSCLDAAHDGSLGFPEIVGRLMAAGFESYAVDYRCNTQSWYLPDGDHLTLPMQPAAGHVASTFDVPMIERLVRWAQTNPADYSYTAFCEKAKAAGCAGYIVSFLGRRVVYFGRSAATHVEHFPA